MANPVQEIDAQVRHYLKGMPSVRRLLPPPPSPRQTELTLMGATVDVAQWLLGMLPVVGDIVADIVGDNIETEMRRRFTPAERTEFSEQTRFLPSSLAAWRAVERTQLRGLGGL